MYLLQKVIKAKYFSPLGLVEVGFCRHHLSDKHIEFIFSFKYLES